MLLHELEGELGESMRGVRLIGELRLEGALHRQLIQAVQSGAWGIPGHLRFPAYKYPRILVCYLVAEGTFSYRGGTYWPNLSVRGLDHMATGEDFEKALRRLGLETFGDLVRGEKALRFLCPILSHAGIPEYCVSDFFRLLIQELGRGATDAEDMIAIWRARKTSFQGIDVPVKRFLLCGGHFALDRLERSLALIDQVLTEGVVSDGVRAGLPEYIVQGFLAMPEETRQYRKSGTSLPRPRVRVDPWEGLGPVVELPPVHAQVASERWEVNDGQRTWSFPTSTSGSRTVRLVPASAWSVTLDPGSPGGRRYVFMGLDQQSPVLFFDPSDRRLIRTANELHCESVWALVPEGTQIDSSPVPNLRVIEDAPAPTGDWRRYALRHYDLEGVSRMRVSRDGGVLDVRVLAPGQRPRFLGDVVPGVTVDGHRVYPDLPLLVLPALEGTPLDRWQVSVRSSRTTVEARAADLPNVRNGCSLGPLVSGHLPAVLEVIVRGPLGLDLRDTFAVVPGVKVQPPADVLLPQDQDAQVIVELSEPCSLIGHEGHSRVVLAAPTEGDEIEVAVTGPGGACVPLRVAVPRLLWAVTRSDSPAVQHACQTVGVGADDLEDGIVQHLAIRLRMTDVPIALMLEASGTCLQRTERFKTAGGEGRWAFSLGQFKDSIRDSGAAELDLILEVHDRYIRVARISARLRVGSIRATSLVEGENTRVEMSFDENRPLRNREARLWSLLRPWEAPTTAPIPDHEHGRAVVTSKGNLPPGRYLAEIAVNDPWVSPMRPRRGAQNSADIWIGDYQQRQERLLAGTGATPEIVLENLLATGELSRALTPDEIDKLSYPALEAALFCIEDGQEPGESLGFGGLVRLLAEQPESLARAVACVARKPHVSKQALLSVTIGAAHALRITKLPVVPDEVMREVWQAAAPLAAAFDAPFQAFDPAAAARCEEFLGITGIESIETGSPCSQNDIGAPREILRARQEYCQLVPGKWLQLDELVLAYFEWIIACMDRGPDFGREWWEQNHDFVENLPELPLHARAHLTARLPAKGTEPWAGIPAVTLAAALHVWLDTDWRDQSVRTLLRAQSFATLLVARDLLLARVLTLDEQGD